MPRRRYLDKAAPADATYNSIRPVYRNIQVKKKDTPQRRENEAAKARARAEQARVTPANPRQASIGPYREKTAIDKAGGRLYAAAEQRAKDAQDREAAGVVLNALFKPIMPSTYVDMYDAYKRGEVNNVSDALAAPYVTGSWSQRNPGKALATDIVAPFALSKAGKLVRFAGSDIADSWKGMRYALAHPESQVYGIAANSPYSIETIPGYHIGSLQRGNVLEKQLSKAGTISLKSIQGVINNPNTPKVDKYILQKVLNKHSDSKVVDYNTLRREAQKLVPKYNRVSKKKFADYGAESLGLTGNSSIDEPYLARVLPEKYWDDLKDFNRKDISAFDELDAKELYLYDNPEVFDKFKNILLAKKPAYNTFTFESPGIVGNTQHYSGEPLGHTRTYVTANEPNVLHIMETQSDWGQRPLSKPHLNETRGNTTAYLNDPNAYREFINRHKGLLERMEAHPEEYIEGAIERQRKNIEHHEAILSQMLGDNPIINRLHNNYLQRQLQENMLYGAETGKSLMRYPTPETAARIESYPRGTLTPEYKKLEEEYNNVVSRISNNLFVEGYKDTPEGIKNYELLHSLTNKMRGLKETNSHLTYAPNHQTILKKYADFPKMFNRLFKGQQVRNVTDNLGNTWYEVDIPTDMLQRELKFKLGGRIIK